LPHAGARGAALARLHEGQETHAEHGVIGSQWRYHHTVRLVGLYTGDSYTLDLAPRDTVTPYGLVETALNAALNQRSDEARRLLDKVQALPSDSIAFLASAPAVVEAALAAAAGEWEDVIDLLADMEEWTWPHRVVFTPRYGSLVLHLLARAYEATGQLDSAAVYQHKLASPVQLARRHSLGHAALHYPFAHRNLVILYSRMGRVEDAEKHWKIFRATFTNPDPDLVPLVEEAWNALEDARARGR